MSRPFARCWCAVVLILGSALSAEAEVLRVEVESRAEVLDGRRFDRYGPYELLRGHIVFGFDPDDPMNARIADLGLAPRNADGLVEARANFVVLQPADPALGRGVALVEVSNRGGKASMRYFNRASTSSLDPDDPAAFGDGLLMRLGLTVVWVGWQFDVPADGDGLRLETPVARAPDGAALTGLVRSDWTVDEPADTLPLGHRGRPRPYPVLDPDDPVHVLTVRDGREAPRRTVPRERWRFVGATNGDPADRDAIALDGGFEVGKIYELVYRGTNPVVVGLGLGALRDVAAYAKHAADAVFPVRHTLAVGISQTGRLLRHFLYQGFNTDEQGRQAYDGLMILTAGAGRGSFNHRFAQPSRDAHRYSAFFYPTDLFPFTGRTVRDPETGVEDGLLAHLRDPAHAPRTFYVNTGYEYWGRAASLLHTTPDGRRDVEPLPNERIYHIASGQHFVDAFPPDVPQPGAAPVRAYRGNPLDLSVAYRALLVELVGWVAEDDPPPPSRIPTLADGTLVAPEAVAFPEIPGVAFPTTIHVAYRADYGPRWAEQGIVDVQPPRLGPAFPSLAAQVDSLGNEVGGVRSVEVRAPLATYTPWNLRTGAPGGAHELSDFRGTYILLPRTAEEAVRTGDPRPAVLDLYRSKADYLVRVLGAAEELLREGFLLAEDLDHVLARAEAYWDWVFSG